MEPFAKRCLTADDHDWSELLSMGEGLDRDLESDEDTDESKISGKLVDTAMLVANKVIYNEAVQVFYDMNTICIEPQLASLRNFSTLRTTDLSLANHAICRLQASGFTFSLKEDMAGIFNHTQFIAFRFVPVTFSRVRKFTVYIYPSSLANPVWSLYHTHGALSKIDGVSHCSFANVGSVVASFDSRPELEIIAQCEAMARHWAECSLDPMPDKHADTLTMSANALRRFNEAHPGISRMPELSPGLQGRPGLENDDNAYWTFVENLLHSDVYNPLLGLGLGG